MSEYNSLPGQLLSSFLELLWKLIFKPLLDANLLGIILFFALAPLWYLLNRVIKIISE